MAERTGCPVLLNLWSYVKILILLVFLSPDFVRAFEINKDRVRARVQTQIFDFAS